MAKTEKDKYYTRDPEIKKTLAAVRKYIPLEEITEIIEPSAGDGAFCEELLKLGKELGVPVYFYDKFIDDKDTRWKIEQKDFKDFLKENSYKKGRIFIGNPPFGSGSSLFKLFRDGAVKLGDWAVYIGPASHWNVYWGLNNMRLIYTELLGNVEFRGPQQLKVNTCLNIYKREEIFMDNEGKKYEVINLHTKNGGRKEADIYIRSYLGQGGNLGDVKYSYDDLDSYVWLGIKIFDKSLYEKINEFCLTFSDKFKKEIDKTQAGVPGFNISFFSQRLEEELSENNFIEDNFKIGILGNPKYGKINIPEYNFLIGASGGIECSGKLYRDFDEMPRALTYFWIKVLNPGLMEKTKEFFERFHEMFKEELNKKKIGNMTHPSLLWFKLKMADYFGVKNDLEKPIVFEFIPPKNRELF